MTGRGGHPLALGRLPAVLPRRVVVRGPSMAPTLVDGDVVLVVPTAVPGARARAGRVALVGWARRPGQLSVKRLHLELPEPDPRYRWFALGDAPTASTDSRELGPAAVWGVVVARLWPRPARLPRV